MTSISFELVPNLQLKRGVMMIMSLFWTYFQYLAKFTRNWPEFRTCFLSYKFLQNWWGIGRKYSPLTSPSLWTGYRYTKSFHWKFSIRISSVNVTKSLMQNFIPDTSSQEWTGFYMIGTSVMKELNLILKLRWVFQNSLGKHPWPD